MQLTFLGTSSGAPTKQRNVTSIALDLTDSANKYWLFDCGEGTQQQILHSGFSTNKIKKIFISHLHGDHIFGLPGLISSRAMHNCSTDLDIYGPVGLKLYIETSLAISSSRLTFNLHIHEIEQGLVFDDGQYKVLAYALDHRVPCFAYRIEQTQQPRKLDSQRLAEDHIPNGPWLKQIKQGLCVTLEDGREINGADYLLPAKQGLRIAIFGDTRPCANALLAADQVDLMVHETTYAQALTSKAEEYGHSTTIQTATIAKQARAKCLIATHLSSRYVSEADLARLLAECRSVFECTYLAYDFMQFKL